MQLVIYLLLLLNQTKGTDMSVWVFVNWVVFNLIRGMNSNQVVCLINLPIVSGGFHYFIKIIFWKFGSFYLLYYLIIPRHPII